MVSHRAAAAALVGLLGLVAGATAAASGSGSAAAPTTSGSSHTRPSRRQSHLNSEEDGDSSHSPSVSRRRPRARHGALAVPTTHTTLASKLRRGSTVTFRAKGAGGGLPLPRLGGHKDSPPPALDTRQRRLHVLQDGLLLEVEGEANLLHISTSVVPEGQPEQVGTTSSAPGTTSSTNSSRLVFRAIPREEAPLVEGDPGYVSTLHADALYGFYNLPSGPHAAVVTRSRVRFADAHRDIEFRQVARVMLVPVGGPGMAAVPSIASSAAAAEGGSGGGSGSEGAAAAAQAVGVAPAALLREARESEEARLTELLRQAFAAHQLYFSHVHDVTHSLQRRAELKEAAAAARGGAGGSGDGSGGIDWRRSDERFFWNREVLAPLLEVCDGGDPAAARAAALWATPVMSAFMQLEEGCTVGDHGFTMLFVSRRSCRRQGMRYTRRGIDSEGNVANFVETEQALLHDGGEVTAHVQVRGSIPLYWSSPVNLQYHPPVRLGDDDALNVAALRRHALSLARAYGAGPRALVFVNLVDRGKEQGRLGEAFERTLQLLKASANTAAAAAAAARPARRWGFGAGGGEAEEAAEGGGGGGEDEAWPHAPEALEHVWFDFHREVKAEGGWANLDKLLSRVDSAVGEHGFLLIGADGAVCATQRGVVRTNCMDCLDRTNVVQSLLARRSLLAQLRAVGADVPAPDTLPDSALLTVGEAAETAGDGGSSAAAAGGSGSGGSGSGGALTPAAGPPLGDALEARFRDVWGNNADEIAVLYAGTPALKGDFTRTGRRTKVGAVKDGANSVVRYLVNNFQDHRRQEAVDLLLTGRAATSGGGAGGSAVDRSAAANAWDDLRASVDLDLWTRLSLPNGRSNAIRGTLYVGIRRRKPAAAPAITDGTTAAAAPATTAAAPSAVVAASSAAAGAAALERVAAESSEWSDDDVGLDGGAEFLVGGIDLPLLGSVLTGGGDGGAGAGVEYARVGMAGLALLALCGEMGPRQLAALLGGLLFVPLLQLLRG